MENQINIGDQNTQQIKQNSNNQPLIAQKKLKINYLIIGGIILVCFLLFGFGGYYLGKQLISNESASLDVTANWNTYKFADYPLEFKYPSALLTLKEKPDPYESNFIVGLYRGDEKIMTIRPEQQGVGFENPDVEITNVPLIVDGKPVIIGGKEVQKTKLYDKKEKIITYIIIIPYPDQRNYSVMIPSFLNDNNQNKQLSETFDRIISTINFTK